MDVQERSSAETSNREALVTRIIDAPRELVFKAWTDPTMLSKWFAPNGFTVSECRNDLRLGGSFRIVMRAADGKEFPQNGIYHEIAPPSRLVWYSDLSDHPQEFFDMIREHGGDPAEVNAMNMLTLDDVNGKTKLTLSIVFPSAHTRNAFVNTGMNEGWGQLFEKLDELVKSVTAAESN